MTGRPLALTAALLLGVSGCSEPPFAHTNPLDSHTPRELRIVGAPDTIRSRFMDYALELVADPPVPAGIRHSWFSGSPAIVFPFDSHVMRGIATLKPQVAQAGAQLGDRSVIREFVLLQRAGALDASCNNGTCVAIPAFDMPFSVTFTGHDEHGDVLHDIPSGFGRATFTSRVEGLVERDGTENSIAARFRSRANGSGWIVVSMDGVMDSVFVSVIQRAATWTPVCPGPMSVGETTMLSTTDHVDLNGFPLSVLDEGIQWHAADFPAEGQAIGVLQDGTLTAHEAGTWIARSITSGPVMGFFADCETEVLP